MLTRPMSSPVAPDWDGAQWVGQLEDTAADPDPAAGAVLALDGAGGYRRARLLIRHGGAVRGFVGAEIVDGAVSVAELAAAVAALPAVEELPEVTQAPLVSVVICTRDRTDQLRAALASVLALAYPCIEVVVVDNAPSTTATAEYLDALGEPRVRLVTEPRAGLARARNAGVLAARGDVVAFTDDDVVVDPLWVDGLLAGFARAADAGCVCGLVPSGELRSRTQAYFDQRVSWADSARARVFRLREPQPDLALFPFQVGAYGTGANFALRRSAVHDLGGFDEALGVGTPTGGGEDIDMFVRVLLAGHALVVEPSAVVWHRHRDDLAALRIQARGYGLGLGAWLAKVAVSRQAAPLALRRCGGALRRLVGLGRGTGTAAPTTEAEAADARFALPADFAAGLGRIELLAVARGPWRYLQARRLGARARPLAPLVALPEPALDGAL